MFNQFSILKLNQQFERTVLKFQTYCLNHDIHNVGYKSLTPLVKIDNDGYQEQLTLNKDLKEEILKSQVQLQTLLEIVENDNDALVEKLGHVKPSAQAATHSTRKYSGHNSDAVKPPAQPATHSTRKDSGDDSDTFNL